MQIDLQPAALQTTLTCFSGATLTDAWVQVSRPVTFRFDKPTALIVGSTLEFEGEGRRLAARDHLAELCNGLAKTLAYNGYNLVNGACPGLPDLVMEAFASLPRQGICVGLSAYPSPIEHTGAKSFAPLGFPLRADLTVFCGTGFELLNVLNTLCADILIVIGGGIGTLLEVATAVEQELPVVCLGPSGGVANEIESMLRRYIATFKNFTVTTVETLESMKESLAEFSASFHTNGAPSRLGALVEEVAEQTTSVNQGVRIIIANDSRSVTYATGKAAITLHNPVLMTDRARIARIPGRGEAILHALDEHPRTYEFDNVSVTLSPRQQRIVWGPSIDTVLLLRCLKELDLLPATRVLEVGSSCGLVSLWLVQSERADYALGIDTDKVAILCARWNASRLGIEDRCAFRATHFDDLAPESFDLVVCNPPYLPYPQGITGAPMTYAGTALLANFLDRFDLFLSASGVALVVLSSASYLDHTIARRLANLREQGQATRLQVAEIPMKVGAVLRNEQWLAYLTCGSGITERTDDDYRYWHGVEVWRLSAKA